MSRRSRPHYHSDLGWISGVAFEDTLTRSARLARRFTRVRRQGAPRASSPHGLTASASHDGGHHVQLPPARGYYHLAPRRTCASNPVPMPGTPSLHFARTTARFPETAGQMVQGPATHVMATPLSCAACRLLGRLISSLPFLVSFLNTHVVNIKRSGQVARKVLAVASGGGHWIQLLRLSPAFEGLDVAYVTLRRDYATDVPGRRFYVVPDVTRWDRFKLVLLALKIIRILIIERPQVVVTTGSAPGFVTLALARVLLRSKTVWIDSIANCERISSSGLQARRVSDVWLTQWPHLQHDNGPQYWGAVL